MLYYCFNHIMLPFSSLVLLLQIFIIIIIVTIITIIIVPHPSTIGLQDASKPLHGSLEASGRLRQRHQLPGDLLRQVPQAFHVGSVEVLGDGISMILM